MSIKKDILKLSKYDKLSEKDFIQCFNRYSQEDALITLGMLSKRALNRDAFYEHLHQFILAYYSNIFLLTSPYRAHKFSAINKDDIKNLVVLYLYKLKETFTEDNNLTSFLLRTYYEQFVYSIPISNIIARNFCLFFKDNVSDELNDIFKLETGLTIYSYLKIAFYLFAMKPASFTLEEFENYFKDTDKELKSGDISKFLQIMSLELTKFKRLDKELKSYIKFEIYDKNRFNLLKKYPVVKINERYIIPNSFLFITKAFDLFWWLEEYYKNTTSNSLYFRNNFFKTMFENYVEKTLTKIYSKNSVKKIFYKKHNSPAEFFDCCVIENNIAYLFEVKAYRFNLSVMNSGDINNEIFKRFIEPKIQCYKRIGDLKSRKFSELKIFEDKLIVPIIIYYDIPFCNGGLIDEEIEIKLQENKDKILSQIQEYSLDNLLNFKCYNLSIQELELYFNASKKNITLHECLNKNPNKYQLSSSFMENYRELMPNLEEGNTYLNNLFEEFTHGVFKDCGKFDKSSDK